MLQRCACGKRPYASKYFENVHMKITGCESLHSHETILGCESLHGHEMILGCESLHGHETILGCESLHGHLHLCVRKPSPSPDLAIALTIAYAPLAVCCVVQGRPAICVSYLYQHGWNTERVRQTNTGHVVIEQTGYGGHAGYTGLSTLIRLSVGACYGYQ